MTDSTEKEREEAAEVNQEIEMTTSKSWDFFHTSKSPSYL